MERKKLIRLVISSLQDILSEEDDRGGIPVEDFSESTYLIGPRSFLDSLTHRAESE